MTDNSPMNDFHWQPAKEKVFTVPTPYGWQPVVHIDGSGCITLWSGQTFHITQEDEIDFFLPGGAIFQKADGMDQPLYVAVEDGPVYAFTVVDSQLYVAKIANPPHVRIADRPF